MSRDILSSARTYYVRTDGNNTNDGLSNSYGGAYRNISKAIDTVLHKIDQAGFDVTIPVGDGTYTETVEIDAAPFGGGATPHGIITLRGNPTTPANCHISASAQCILARNSAHILLDGFKLTSANANNIHVVENAAVYFKNIDFGASGANAGHINANSGGIVAANGSYKISGGGKWHVNANRCGMVTLRACTITLVGTPHFSTGFVFNETGGVALMDQLTFSGLASGPRCLLKTCGIIDTGTGSGTYLPGNVVGSIYTGGQYT